MNNSTHTNANEIYNNSNMSSPSSPIRDDSNDNRAIDHICAKLHSQSSQKTLRKIIKAKDNRAKFKHEGWLKASDSLKKERQLRKQVQKELAHSKKKHEEERLQWQREKEQLEQEKQRLTKDLQDERELNKKERQERELVYYQIQQSQSP